MTVFNDTWDYLTTASNWTGPDGMLVLMSQQLLISVTALALAMLIGLPIALWLGHLGRGGFLAINVSNVGRAVPTFALLAVLVTADWPGTRGFGPYGRAGLATIIALTLFALPPIITNANVAMREVSPSVRQAADGMGMTGLAEVLPGRAAAGLTAGHVGHPTGAGAGLGDRDDRRPRRRSRDSAGSSPTASTAPTTARGSPGRSWSPWSRWCSRSWPPWRSARSIRCLEIRHPIVTRECLRRVLWLLRRPTPSATSSTGHARTTAGHRR